MKNTAQKLIESLDLLPHPEGGYYRENYRSDGVIPKNVLPYNYSGNRNYSTAIYFLLTSDNFSAFHKINQDEVWHYYTGSPIQIHVINDNGEYHCQEVGTDFANGAVPQYLVHGGAWFASSVKDKNSFSLVGCTVAPGFDFDDFVLGSRKKLSQTFPQHKEIVIRYTRTE